MQQESGARITIHMAQSADGFISRHDEDVGWFETDDTYENGVEHEARSEADTPDCFVMGSHTYALAVRLGWIYGDVPTTVLTRRALEPVRPTVEFHAGDLTALVNGRLRNTYRNIWVVGGANVCTEFVRLGLADDIRLSILPVLLGDGIPFYEPMAQAHALHLKDAKADKNGIVSLWYEIRRGETG